MTTQHRLPFWTFLVILSPILLAISYGLFGTFDDQERWSLVYAHDEAGQEIDGSKADLIAAVRAGKPIRVYWAGGRVEHTADAVFLTVFGDEVFAQLPRIRPQRPSRTTTPPEIELGAEDQEWTAILSTTGGFAVRWYVED